MKVECKSRKWEGFGEGSDRGVGLEGNKEEWVCVCSVVQKAVGRAGIYIYLFIFINVYMYYGVSWRINSPETFVKDAKQRFM